MAVIELNDKQRTLLITRAAEAFGTETALELWLAAHRPEWVELLEIQADLGAQLKKLVEHLRQTGRTDLL